MGISKEEKLRREMLAYACRLVKSEGIEALESRITRSDENNLTPCTISDTEMLRYKYQTIMTSMTVCMACMFLAVETVFGDDVNALDKLGTDFAEQVDAVYGGYNDWKSTVDYFKDRGVKFDKYLNKASSYMDDLEIKLQGRKDFVGNGRKL